MSFLDYVFGWVPWYRQSSGRAWYLCRVDGACWWYPDCPHPQTTAVLRVEEFHGRV